MGYLAPQSLSDALEALARLPSARIVAGGTDLFAGLGDGPGPDDIVDLSRVPDLRGVTRTATGWRIGGATTWSDLVRADLPACFDGLRAAAREVGSVQIQNAGTLAGNLCNASPAADGVPPLLALAAEVEIASREGLRRMPLDAFLLGARRTALGPGEVLAAIHVSSLPEAARAAFVKLGARRYLVISIVMVAVVAIRDGDRIAEVRIAVGAASPVARRLPLLEAALAGCRIAALPAITPDHLAPLTPLDDIRSSAGYRLEAAAELIGRALRKALGDG